MAANIVALNTLTTRQVYDAIGQLLTRAARSELHAVAICTIGINGPEFVKVGEQQCSEALRESVITLLHSLL